MTTRLNTQRVEVQGRRRQENEFQAELHSNHSCSGPGPPGGVSGGVESGWLWGGVIGLLAGTFVGGRFAGKVEQVATDTGWRPSYRPSDGTFLPCVLAGFFLAPGSCWERRESTITRTRKDEVPGLVGGVVAGVLGGVLGFRLKHEAWRSVLLPQDTVTVGFAHEPIFVGRDRLRVSVVGRQLIGQLAAVTDEGLEFTRGEMRRSFAYRDIDSLKRSVGMRIRWKTGLDLGLLGGFVAFPTFNDAWGCVAEDWQSPSCKEKGSGMLAWMGRGGLLGLGASFLMRRESWESIQLRDDVVGLSPIVSRHTEVRGDGTACCWECASSSDRDGMAATKRPTP